MLDKAVLSTVYCDDVRQEVTGKMMLIGCYNTHMFIPKLPAKIPQLYACFNLRRPIDDRSKKLVLEVRLNDKVIMTHNYDLDKSGIEKPESDIEYTETQLTATVGLVNLAIEGDSVLNLVANLDDMEIDSNKLRIITTPS